MMPSVGEDKSQDLKRIVWQTVCHHIDGIAIGSTVHALALHNVFDLLRMARSPVHVNGLAAQVRSKAGFFHVAMRLLADQGFVKLSGDMDSGTLSVSLTDAGVRWRPFVELYHQIPPLPSVASNLPSLFSTDKGSTTSQLILPKVSQHLEASPLRRRVALHLYGELVAVIMTEWYRKGVLQKLLSHVGACVQLDEISSTPTVSRFVTSVLEEHGWGRSTANSFTLTDLGVLAASWTPQYFYPVSYLSTFRRVPQLLFGSGLTSNFQSAINGESHVDRSLDITFSGLVFQKTCKRPFLEVVLPIFNREPLKDQPACVVDTGSGDGTLLAELFSAIRDQTLRGQEMDSYPLIMVSAEYTSIAREATRATLEASGIPHRIIFGDIGDPCGLSKRLGGQGLDPDNALHVSKSVIHNRLYKPPENTERLRAWTALSQAPFTLPNGDLVRPRDLECNLVELFENWAPFTKKHGMVVIEAHTVNPELTSSRVGENIMTCVDATHGYSHQYLVEYEVFERSAQEAGYRLLAYRELGSKLLGRPTMTLSHFIPDKA